MSWIFLFSCNKEEKKNNSLPTCIQSMINDIESKPVWNPPASIYKSQYNNQTVFLVSSDCCDQYINLYDENCNFICAPGGGISGDGDGRCADYYDSRIATTLVYQDSR